MDDLAPLRFWIQEQHLQPETLVSYQNSLKAHPARLVVLKQFLQKAVAERLSKFLNDDAEFQPVYGLYSRDNGTPDEQEWLNADERDRLFRFSRIAGLPPEHRLSPNTLTYLRFRKSLEDMAFTRFFERLSGITLRWSDSFAPHAMGAGDFLKLHDDNGKNRQLALVIYLSPDWQPSFGGALVVIDGQGRRTTIEPEYNIMAAFDITAGTTHFIEEVSAVAGDRRRMTISGWYGKPE